MFFAIFLALSSICTSCSSTDKTSSDKADVNIESEAKSVSTSHTVDITTEELTAESSTIEEPKEKLILSVEKSTPTIKVSVGTDEVTKSRPTDIVPSKPTASSPQIAEPIITEEVKEIKSVVVDKKYVASHADFNALLQKHVSNGLVNYAGFKADATKFDAYLDYLSSNAPSTSDKSKTALAFWMNAYNAFTIKLIVDNLPVVSIRDLHNGKPWDKKWITIGGESYSLNNIEHDIIRPVFNEPRIHFAIVCAAISCPPLDNKAFTADTVDSHLESLSKSFINNPKFNTITESKVTITPIMDWYGKDFDSVLGFVQKYANTTVGDKAKVKFTDYDWSLNEQ